MRYLYAILLGTAVAVGLFVMMQYIVSRTEARLDDKAGRNVIDFVRLKHESDVETKKRALPQKQAAKDQPTPPAMDLKPSSALGGLDSTAVSIAPPDAPTTDHKVDLAGGPNLGGSAPADSGSIPLVRIQPIYPREAAERRVTGWVVLEFTISTSGTVKNARVIQAQPPGIFDQAALKAIRKWKYKAKVVDGKPEETPGVQVKLTFELEE